VNCGRQLGQRLPTERPAPSLALLVIATSLVELVCAASVIFAIVWSARQRDLGGPVIVWAAVSAVSLVSGAMAYRGGVKALIVGALTPTALALFCLLQPATVIEVLRVAQVFQVVENTSGVVAGLAITGLLATTLCICAVPQARRLTAWQLERLERAYRVGGARL
jgi:hypothetical protein